MASGPVGWRQRGHASELHARRRTQHRRRFRVVAQPGNLARLTRSSRAAFWPNWVGVFGASVVAAVVGSSPRCHCRSRIPRSGSSRWPVSSSASWRWSSCALRTSPRSCPRATPRWWRSKAVAGGCSAPRPGRAGRRDPRPGRDPGVLPDRGVRELRTLPVLGCDRAGPAVCGADRRLLHPAAPWLSVRDLFLPADRRPTGTGRGSTPWPSPRSQRVRSRIHCCSIRSPMFPARFPYTTASIPAFVVAGTLHVVLTKTFVQPLGLGGYDRRPRVAVGAER